MVRTEVSVYRRRGAWALGDGSGAVRHWGTWREPTVGLWRRGGLFRAGEQRVWEYALLDTSLTRVTHIENRLSPETLQEILRYIPGMVPSRLVRQYLDQVTVTSRESLRIERECYSLWAGSGSSVRNPHPDLEVVVTAMGLYDKLGVRTWDSLDDIPVKTYHVMRQVLVLYSQIMDQNTRSVALRQKAIKAAGIEHYVGK